MKHNKRSILTMAIALCIPIILAIGLVACGGTNDADSNVTNLDLTVNPANPKKGSDFIITANFQYKDGTAPTSMPFTVTTIGAIELNMSAYGESSGSGTSKSQTWHVTINNEEGLHEGSVDFPFEAIGSGAVSVTVRLEGVDATTTFDIQ